MTENRQDSSFATSRLAAWGFMLILVLGSITLLVEGRSIFVPIAISIIVWFLLSAVASALGRVRMGGSSLPTWLCLAIAILVFIAAGGVLIEVLGRSLEGLIKAAPRYERNLDQLLARLSSALPFKTVVTASALVEKINFGAAAGKLAATAAGFFLDLAVICVYVVFLLAEAQVLPHKIARMVPDERRRRRMAAIVAHIQAKTQEYIWIECQMGLLIAVLTYAVLALVGVEFPLLWAAVIFILSFIPTIGTFLGIAFPALLALLQFETIRPFVIVVVALGAIQLLVNNWLQPRIMGKSLDLSSFVIMFALAVSGSIWGIVGATIAVPLLVIAMIIFAQFPSTCVLAVALSGDGDVEALTFSEDDGAES